MVKTAEVGKNIRARRKKLRLTLSAVAGMSGISQGFLSQVENNKVRPSLDTLKKISVALQTNVGVLLQQQPVQSQSILVRKAERDTIEDDIHHVKIESLSETTFDRMLETFIFTFTEKSTSIPSKYQHFGQEFILVLEGEIKVTLDSQEYYLKEGDSLYFNSGVMHSFENVSVSESRVLSINTPPSF